MADHYRYGIDLGTTNSVIARFDEGRVHVFTNPSDFGRHTLPSVVGWRKDRVLVGRKAREYGTKKAGRGSFELAFKRRMGTSESFRIAATGNTVTPVDLSAEVLKELRRFVTDDDSFSSAIITIPACFDTQQANATAEAGRLAGIEHVALLQEPIAASLAYANEGGKGVEHGKWLVYDLGGGTFDVALVKVIEDQLRVVDHEGDNFLGGRDFDAMIVDRLVVPVLEDSFSFTDLEKALKAKGSKYAEVYEALLWAAEEAKIALSTHESAEIDVNMSGFEDEDGGDVFATIPITRGDFEKMIRPHVNRTIEMMQVLLTRNKVRGSDLAFVLLVGGSTYIPCVRELVGQSLEAPVRSDFDPTTAVAVGAAHFASTKTVPEDEDFGKKPAARGGIRLKAAYQRSSKDTEEYYAARVEGWRPGLRYRIVRRDGGYDSHWKELGERIAEDLPLREGEFNYFTVEVTDEQGRAVAVDGNGIAIAHGKLICRGQPVPEDISLELDKDAEPGRTRIDPLFARNAVLPLTADRTYTINRTMVKGSSEDVFRIRVMEGPSDCVPEACLCIGELRIDASQLHATAYKGADIEITVRLEENRELCVDAHLPSSDQSFSEIFHPGDRDVRLPSLRADVAVICDSIDEELAAAESSEDYERAHRLKELRQHGLLIEERLDLMGPKDATDARFQCDNEKQHLAAEFSKITRDKHLREAREQYTEALAGTETLVEEFGNDEDRERLRELLANEHVISSSSNERRVESELSRVYMLYWDIQMRRPEFLTGFFQELSGDVSSMNQPAKAEALVKQGKAAVDSADWGTLRQVNHELLMLLPNRKQSALKTKIGFSQ